MFRRLIRKMARDGKDDLPEDLGLAQALEKEQEVYDVFDRLVDEGPVVDAKMNHLDKRVSDTNRRLKGEGNGKAEDATGAAPAAQGAQ